MLPIHGGFLPCYCRDPSADTLWGGAGRCRGATSRGSSSQMPSDRTLLQRTLLSGTPLQSPVACRRAALRGLAAAAAALALGGSCGFGQRAKLDLEAKLGNLGDQASGFDLAGAVIEVVGPARRDEAIRQY
jgi:hypothetical protein